MKAFIDIGDQKTGSKSRQRFLELNKEEIKRQGVYSLKSTKVGSYDMGLAAFASAGGERKAFCTAKGISGDIDIDSFIEKNIKKELDGKDACKVVFSFEGLLHLKDFEVEKLMGLLNKFFDEVYILCFVRRQDRKAVSDYTTRLRNAGEVELNILYKPNGSPRGSDYYHLISNWARYVPVERVRVINYDTCLDVRQALVGFLDISGELVFEDMRANSALSALGAEVLRVFNKDLSLNNEYKDRASDIRAKVKDFYVGDPLRPSKKEAQKHFENFSESNKKLANLLGSESPEYFDEDFSRYPEAFSPCSLQLSEVVEYVETAIKEYASGNGLKGR